MIRRNLTAACVVLGFAGLSACNISFDVSGAELDDSFDPFPEATRAIVGFPWDKVDFTTKHPNGAFAGRVMVGDSVILSYRMLYGAGVPLAQLKPTQPTAWESEGRAFDNPATLDTSTATIRPTGKEGEAVFRPTRAGYWISPRVTEHGAATSERLPRVNQTIEELQTPTEGSVALLGGYQSNRPVKVKTWSRYPLPGLFDVLSS